MPIYVNMLVFKENNLGSYVATEHPDQSTVVKPGAGAAARERVVEGRLLVQITF
jgi:hypothetical protein